MLSCFCMPSAKSSLNGEEKAPSFQSLQRSPHSAPVDITKTGNDASPPKTQRAVLRFKAALRLRTQPVDTPVPRGGSAAATSGQLSTSQPPQAKPENPAEWTFLPMKAAAATERTLSEFSPAESLPGIAVVTLDTEGCSQSPHGGPQPRTCENCHSARSWVRSSGCSSGRQSGPVIPLPHDLGEAATVTAAAGSDCGSPASGTGRSPHLLALAVRKGGVPGCSAGVCGGVDSANDGRAGCGMLGAATAAADADNAIFGGDWHRLSERSQGAAAPLVPEPLESLLATTGPQQGLGELLPTSALDDGNVLPGPAAPRATVSRRGALLQAARSLQQHTSLRRAGATSPPAAARPEAIELTAAAQSGNEQEGRARLGCIRQGKSRPGASAAGVVSPTCNTGGYAALRVGRVITQGSVRIPCAAAPPGGPRGHHSSWRLAKQHTPLLLRRLRVTASGSCSESYGHVDVLELGPAVAATPTATTFITNAITATVANNCDYHTLCSYKDGGSADGLITAAGAFGPPPIETVQMMTPSESPGFLRTASPLEVSPIQDPDPRALRPSGGRHPHFTCANSRGGVVASPRTTAPALLARQQTPCPLRWAALSPRWEDSGDTPNDAAGRCWSAAAPTSAASELEGGAQDSAVGDGGRAQCGMRTTQIGDGEGREFSSAGTRPSSAGSSRSRTTHGFSRLMSPGSYDPYNQHVLHLHTGPQPQPQPHPHLRSLRVQLSLSKLRRPSLSSVVSLVAADGELSTAGSISMALRTPIAGAGGGNRHGGGVVTPTRHGRRRNLAGNENMSWELVLQRFVASPVPVMAGIVNVESEAVAGSEPAERGPTAQQSDALQETAQANAAMALQLHPRQQLQREEARPLRRPVLPAPLRRRHESAVPAAPLQMRASPQLQLHELATLLREPSLQQQSVHTTELPLFQQPKPAPLSCQLLQSDPVRAVWSPASSACFDSTGPSSPGQRPLRRVPLLVPERAAELETDFGSPMASIAISPVTRQASCASRLGFPMNDLADGHVDGGGTRASKSSDGRSCLLMPRLAVARSGRGAGVCCARGAQTGSCPAMPRPASVCDIAASTAVSGAAATRVGSMLACCGVTGGVQPRETRRVLYHTGSVRSHAPTEDDSAQSLAKVGSETGCGVDSEKALEFGNATEDLGWGPGLLDPWGTQQPKSECEGPADEGVLPAQKLVGDICAAQEMLHGRRARCRRTAGTETVDVLPALVSGGSDGPRAAAMLLAGATAGGTPPMSFMALNEHFKGAVSMGSGISSRLSRCT